MVEQLFNEFAGLSQVEAIALGGSRAGNNYDAKSDYDVYVYCTEMIPDAVRLDILNRYCSVIELGNHFWELEDNCTLKDGIDIDILYRSLDDFTAGVAQVVEQYEPHNGYTTCMWHNLMNCRIIYDRDKRLEAAVERFDVPYPDQLKKNIIDWNMRLLRKSLPAYELQLLKAAGRGDIVSVNHRMAAFLESYFDIIYAMNGQTHPGEKRMVFYCLEKCAVLPDNFENNIKQLLGHMFDGKEVLKDNLNTLIASLEQCLKGIL